MRMTKKTVAAYGALGCAGVFAAYYLRHAAPILEHIEKHGVIGFVMGALALAIVAGIAAAWATSVGATNLKQAISAGLAVPAIVFAAGIDGGGKPPPETKSAGFSLLAGADGEGTAFLDSLRLFFAPVESRVRAEREKADAAIAQSKGRTLELGARVKELNGMLEAASDRETKLRTANNTANESVEKLERTIKELRSKSPPGPAHDVAVPDLRKLSLVDAYFALRRDGLVLGLSREFLVRPAEWLKTHVAGHRPEPGAKVARGSAIEVEIEVR